MAALLSSMGNLIVGQDSGFPPGNNNSSNSVLIANNGVVTLAGGLIVAKDGYGNQNANCNSVTITNGGQLYAKATSYIGGDAFGYATTAVSNTVTVAGNAALWDLGGTNLYVGYGAGTKINNALTVNEGGVVTNVSALTVSAANALALGAGGRIYAGAVTNAGTMSVWIDDSMSPRSGCLTVAGNLDIAGATLDLRVAGTAYGANVIATYGALTGVFAATNGLPVWGGSVDYAHGGNQIAVIVSPAGAVLMVR
jgi:hypothetical protein